MGDRGSFPHSCGLDSIPCTFIADILTTTPPRNHLLSKNSIHNPNTKMSQRVSNNHINARSSPRQVTPEKRGIRMEEKLSLANPSFRAPSHEEMRAVFLMCRRNQWDSVLNSIRSNLLVATTNMTMDNNISTTILHQAITSKGDVKKRARVIQEILGCAPLAATIKNGYGSLPLHVISQRNTKIDSKTKETLIRALMQAYPESLVQQGGVGMRTPLHIIFTGTSCSVGNWKLFTMIRPKIGSKSQRLLSSVCTILDYISPALTSTMIHCGRQACFMRDKKGFLPIHVACSRHCSPEKLEMLLEVNPGSLFAETDDNRSLLALAKGTATKSHPNYALISEIERRLEMASLSASPPTRAIADQFHVPPMKREDLTSVGALLNPITVGNLLVTSDGRALPTVTSARRQRKSKRKRKPVVKHEDFSADDHQGMYAPRVKREENLLHPVDTSSASSPQQDDSEPANLLLHFSRHMENVTSV